MADVTLTAHAAFRTLEASMTLLRRAIDIVRDIVANSTGTARLGMSDTVRVALNELKEFLFATVYLGSAAKAEVGKMERLLEALFAYYVGRPEEINPDARRLLDDGRATLHRTVCDFLAGMTDRFAIRLHEQLFVPKAWGL
jgi:dGTPase